MDDDDGTGAVAVAAVASEVKLNGSEMTQLTSEMNVDDGLGAVPGAVGGERGFMAYERWLDRTREYPMLHCRDRGSLPAVLRVGALELDPSQR